MKNFAKMAAPAFAMLAFTSILGQANSVSIDERGNGSYNTFPLPSFLAPDPGPGGRNPAFGYLLPFTGTQGDVLISGPEPNVVQDILRFNGDGTVIIYSDSTPISDSVADTPGPPSSLYANQAAVMESGLSGIGDVSFYTPVAGQPGFDAVVNPSYTFFSDSRSEPEPSGLLLIGSGLVGIGGLLRRSFQLRLL